MKGNKFGIIVIILLPLVLGGGYYLNNQNFIKQWDNKFYPKTSIYGIDVSGKTKEEASKLIEEHTKFILEKKINVKYNGRVFTLDYGALDPKHNIENVIGEAYRYGKDAGDFEKAKIIKSSVEKKYDLNFGFNDKGIDDFLDNLEKEIYKEPTNATLKMISSGNFEVKKETLGERLKKEEMKNAIVSKINDLREETVEIDAIIEHINPTVTAEALNKVDSLISSFSTNFSSSQAGRAANVEIATKQIDGVLLMPGETFSFNERTGSRTAAKGYQAAPVIVKNKLEDGLGGGVCQVSTTLYNAVIRANLKSVERRNHSLAPAYVQPGFDATVSDYIDYKFKNTLDFPVYIEGYTKGRQVIFNIYSNGSLKSTKYELINEVYEKTPAETQQIDDPTLPKGTVKEEESPHTGYKVKVYLVAKKNGRELSKEIISNDTYKKVDGIIKIGTME